MNPDERLERILGAVNAAMVGEGDNLVLDLSQLEKGLRKAKIQIAHTVDRRALHAELGQIRDELRAQRTRRRWVDADTAEGISNLIRRLEAREKEITEILWPEP